jgi:hypothetical protein
MVAMHYSVSEKHRFYNTVKNIIDFCRNNQNKRVIVFNRYVEKNTEK